MRNVHTVGDVGDLVRDDFGSVHIFSKNNSLEYGINFKEYGDALFQMIDADIEFLTKK